MLQITPLKIEGYEEVLVGKNVQAGMSAIIAIHNTALGPACGGIRLLPYRSQTEALEDVLKLSKAMTYKSAVAGIAFGGGKSVIIEEPRRKTTQLFQAFGEFLNHFRGRYIAAKDMNIDYQDLSSVKSVSPHVLGIDGVPGSSGDPSPLTAYGIYRALEATIEVTFGQRHLRGLTVAIQGVGHVGVNLAERVHQSGGRLIVSDINPTAANRLAERLGAKVVGISEICEVQCDIFSPCAIGGILNSNSVERFRCRAIVGGANNQLASPREGYRLHELGIIYAPDYVINAGGIINIFVEFEGYEEERARKRVATIYDTVKEILRRSKELNLPPAAVADRIAEERIRQGCDIIKKENI